MMFTFILSPLAIPDICNDEFMDFVNYNEDDKWLVEYVDMAGAVWYTDIVITNSDNVFIAYYDSGGNNLKLAYLKDDEWSVEVVDSAGDVGMYLSIAVDSSGNPHMSYYDETNHDLKYAKWTGSNWNIEVVDSVGDVGWDTSIAIDSESYPHISYFDNSLGDLKYAKWTGSQWNIDIVEAEGRVGCGSSIVLDVSGNPHISYTNVDMRGLFYAYLTELGWMTAVVDSESIVYGSTSIALDSNSRPHIGYFDIDTFANEWYLKYAYQMNSKWNIEIVDPDIKHFLYDWGVSIVVDQFERIHIGYYGWKKWDLHYALRINNKWNIEIVDTEGFVGAFASLAIDSYGYPHISYRDSSNVGLKYAKKIQYCPDPPDQPSGAINGKTREEYTYTTYATDFDGDKIKYGWDWGNGTPIEWTAFYDSGEDAEASYSWENIGTFQIRVIAQDENGYMSEWSDPLPVSMPKSKPYFNTPFLDFLQNHPILYQLLQRFLRL